MYYHTPAVSVHNLIESIFKSQEMRNKDEMYDLSLNFNKSIKDDSVDYEIAMPGLKKEDLKIQSKNTEDGIVLISGSRTNDVSTPYQVSTIKNKHDYKLYLDSTVYDLESIKAKMQDGILYLSVPKRKEKLPKKLEIRVD